MKEGMGHQDIPELQRRIAIYEDEIAYRDLFFLLYAPLKRFAQTFLKSPEISEEVVADVFVEIWTRRARLLEIEDLKMYLYISVRNGALRRMQQARRQPVLSLDEISVELISGDSTPEEALLTSELRLRIEQAVNELPPRCKLIYKLAKEDRLKYREISRLLHIQIKTIDHQLATAVKKIAHAVQFRLKKKTDQI
ncbi:MAG TPA: sigma-70 family RNA polymerase sigma factor [Chitinophagaceae bacterium]|nr:sigma-70 family RNA polymerase sigma factor [Chitinophagaceae bacterium]